MANLPDVMAQGSWKPIQAGSDEAQKDANGFTNPNLHRRLSSNTGGYAYSVSVHGHHSYRYVYIPEHDEESDESEIP